MIEWIRGHCERTPVVLAGVGVSAAVLHSSQTLGLGRPLLPDVRAAAGADRQPGDRRRAARRAPARGHRRRRRSRPCPLRRDGSAPRGRHPYAAASGRASSCSVLMASMALVPLEMVRAWDTLETSRVEEARWDAEWIVEQAMRYGRAEGQGAGDIRDLRRRLPGAHIEATDPWGREWVVAPAFGNVGAPEGSGADWAAG